MFVFQAIESKGRATAEALSRAEAALIEGHAAVDGARLRAQADTIASTSELAALNASRAAELTWVEQQNNLEVGKTRAMAVLESTKFRAMVDAIGREALLAMARVRRLCPTIRPML